VFRSANKKRSPATRQAQNTCKFEACPGKYGLLMPLARVVENLLASTAQLKKTYLRLTNIIIILDLSMGG